MNWVGLSKSIRWRLLGWIALLLGLILLALDVATYEIHLANNVSRLDEELRQRVANMSASVFAPSTRSDPGLRPPGAPDDPGGPPPNGEPPPNLEPPPDNGPPGNYGSPPNGGPPNGTPPEGFNPQPQSDRGLPEAPPGRFSSQPPTGPPVDEARLAAALKRYGSEGVAGFYCAVWTADPGAAARQSTNYSARVPHPRLTLRDTGTYARTREGCREVYHATEHGDCIVVGRTLAPELEDAREFLGMVGAGSAAVLLFGLGGVWLIITRALQPVNKITAAAARSSSGDLSQRINVAETESELGQLAAVLNATFARLDAAFARQQQFTADAAHELRTPVSVMLTHAQNGLAAGCGCAEHRDAFEACQRAAQRMKKLIGALLALARLDDGRGAARRMEFDLASTAGECLALLRPAAQERRVELIADLPPVKIFGDAEQIAQVITNLLANAIQYNRPDGEVRLRLAVCNGQAVLTVSDTGQGIPAKDLPRVFERFYRADQSRSSTGLGLGLAISKAIVTAHGGTIAVDSREGCGATFTVTLPGAGAKESMAPRSSDAPNGGTP